MVFENFFSRFLPKYKNSTPGLWPHPIPGDHDLNKLESLLPKDASTEVAAIIVKWFLIRIL